MSRAIRIYLFVFLYGLVIFILMLLPEAVPLFMASSALAPSISFAEPSGVISQINGAQLWFFYGAIIILASCVIFSLFAALSWIWQNKIHPVSFILSFVVLVPLCALYLYWLGGSNYVSIGMAIYAATLIETMIITCWISKQVYDVEGRATAIQVAEKNANGTILLMSFSVFVVSVIFNFIYTVLPILVVSNLVDQTGDQSFSTLIANPGFNLSIFTCFIMALYFGIALMRQRSLRFVHFTRVGIGMSLLLIFIACVVMFFVLMSNAPTVGMPLGYEMPKGTIMGMIVLMIIGALPVMLSALCGVTVSLSLAFWFVSKSFKVDYKA